jgi:rhodanese-related sulfurtransferase
MRRVISILLVLLLCLTGCTAEGTKTWHHISQEEAREMMARDGGQIIVDVRRQDEYDSGHIPGAVLIPNESISGQKPEQLPDLNQIILIYCRSGRRSREAAQKLADIGYTNIYEFGGIIDWTGEITTDAPGKEISAMILKIGGTEVPVTWEDNPSVDALRELLPLTTEMSMYGGFEQVGSIGRDIVRDDEPTDTDPGDIVLYAGNQIVVFYGNNSWAYTRLGHIELMQQELEDLLAHGAVTLTLEAGAEKQAE